MVCSGLQFSERNTFFFFTVIVLHLNVEPLSGFFLGGRGSANTVTVMHAYMLLLGNTETTLTWIARLAESHAILEASRFAPG